MKHWSDPFLIVSGIRRLDYPRDIAWHAYLTGDCRACDLSIPAAYVNRWGNAGCLAWAGSLVKRHFGWLVRLPTLIRRAREPQAKAIFLYRNNHLLLALLALMRSCRIIRTPVIYDAWISLALKARTTNQARWLVYLLRKTEAWLLNQADVTVVLSEAYGDYYRGIGLKVSDSSPFVVPLTAGPEWEDNAAAAIEPGNCFAYWGTFLEQHGTPLLVQAANTGGASKDYPLVLCGEGKELRGLKSHAENGDAACLQFHGHLPLNTLIAVVDSAGAGFGHLKRCHDHALVLPNKALQAFARGKPVIMVDGPLPDSWRHGQKDGAILTFDGSVAGLRAVMQTLREQDPDQAKRHCLAARAFYAQHHSSSKSRQAMRQLLDQF